uniref:Reverse transcriptase zinc-binding domain-containing protein n=1 Tax=Anolis carolinensis TaxID=28377 RepID=A0A803TA48_ANOCA
MNYNHLWKNISKQIITWGKKFRDISTRLKIYKMKILPKFLFLFQTLPVNIPTNLLKKWDNSMKQWVVGGNKNRIANFLYYSKQEMGGWGAPSLGIYYEASQLARLLEFELEGSKKWVQTEKEANNWQRGTLLGERIDRKDLKNLKAGPCFSMLLIWKKWQNKLQINKIDPFPLETLENKDKTFTNLIRALKENGFKRIGDIMNPKGEILKWDKIKDKCGQGNWIAWLGLSSKAQAMKRREVVETPLDRIIKRKIEIDKGITGLLYDVLITLTYNTKITIIDNWKQEKNFTEKLIGTWIDNIPKIKHIRIKETQRKIISKWYRTPLQVAHITGNTSNKCWHNCGEIGTFSHMWWDCRKIQNFYRKIRKIMEEIIGKELIWDKARYMSLTVKVREDNNNWTEILKYMTAAIQATIARGWRDDTKWNVETWWTYISEYIINDFIIQKKKIYTNSLKDQDWLRKWTVLIDKIDGDERYRTLNQAFHMIKLMY